MKRPVELTPKKDDPNRTCEVAMPGSGFPGWRTGEFFEVRGVKYKLETIYPAKKRIVLAAVERAVNSRQLAPREEVVLKGVTWVVVEIPGGFVLEFMGKASGMANMMARLAGQRGFGR